MQHRRPFSIRDHQDLVEIRFLEGSVLSTSLLRSVFLRELSTPERIMKNDLWDLRPARVASDLEFNGLFELVEEVARVHGKAFHQRTGLVVRTHLQVGLSRMYQHLTESLPFEVGIFMDLDSGRDWVISGQDSSPKQKLA